MDLRAQHNSGRPPSSLIRTTDRARSAIRRAQLLLGALAVAIAMPVGMAAAAMTPAPTPGVGTVRAELLQPSPAPEIALVEAATPTSARWSTPDGETRTGLVWAEAGLAQHTQVTVAVDDQWWPVGPQIDVEDPAVTGLVAGITTVLICWALLAVLASAWRARLAARDDTDWTYGWARVEPFWSRRRT